MIKTTHAQYDASVWEGENKSGIHPVGSRVLVLTDKSIQKTRKGVHLPNETVDKQDAAAESGVLVECGTEAFVWSSDRTRRWEGAKPEPGNRVIFNRYAGQVHVGDDDRDYRVMEDGEIGAIRDDPPEAEPNPELVARGIAEALKAAEGPSLPLMRDKVNEPVVETASGEAVIT